MGKSSIASSSVETPKAKVFNLVKLVNDILASGVKIRKWQDFEELVAKCCKIQDPGCVRNKDADPDILLSNGIGIEAKSTNSTRRSINLNSAAPNPNTFYVIAYCDQYIKNVAVVNGANYYCNEIEKLKDFNTSLRAVSNENVKFRTRIMWHVRNPFKRWGIKNFIVDKNHKVVMIQRPPLNA